MSEAKSAAAPLGQSGFERCGHPGDPVLKVDWKGWLGHHLDLSPAEKEAAQNKNFSMYCVSEKEQAGGQDKTSHQRSSKHVDMNCLAIQRLFMELAMYIVQPF